jgi:hypothetical protein
LRLGSPDASSEAFPAKRQKPMSRIGKINLYSVLTMAGLAVAFVITAYRTLLQLDHDKDLDQQVMLSNAAFLKVHGEESPGPDSGCSVDLGGTAVRHQPSFFRAVCPRYAA